MEQERTIPEKEQELLKQRFARLLAEKLKINSVSSILRTLPDEKDDIPDVKRWR